jgi:hypothetical protein
MIIISSILAGLSIIGIILVFPFRKNFTSDTNINLKKNFLTIEIEGYIDQQPFFKSLKKAVASRRFLSTFAMSFCSSCKIFLN